MKIAIGVGIGIAAVALTAYGIHKMNSSKKNISAGKDALDKLTDTQKDLMNREYDSSLKLFKKKTPVRQGDQGFLEDARNVNPGLNLHPNDPGFNNNCPFCATTYELRRRGYDVAANKTSSGRNMSYAAKFFKGAKVHKSSDNVDLDQVSIVKDGKRYFKAKESNEAVQKILDQIVAEGEGTRGNLSGLYYSGGGHAMAYEVYKGKVILVDGQTGDLYDTSTLGSIFKPNGITWFRTDNLEINPDTIKEAVYTVGEKVKDRPVGDYDSNLSNQLRSIIVQKVREGMSMSEARAWVNKEYGSNL